MRIRPLLLCLALGAALSVQAQTTGQNVPPVRLNAGIHNIVAELARTPEQRATGLMFRREMGENAGMLFVFDQPSVQCFWMRNTLLPLSIAFLADDGSIVNLDDMKPQTETSHCSSKPVRYVLEMNWGWFSKRGLAPGAVISGAPFVAARR